MTEHDPYVRIDASTAALLGLTTVYSREAAEMQAFDSLPRRLREYLNYARFPPQATRAVALLDQLRSLAPNAANTTIERIAVSVLQANDVERSTNARRRAVFDMSLPTA